MLVFKTAEPVFCMLLLPATSSTGDNKSKPLAGSLNSLLNSEWGKYVTAIVRTCTRQTMVEEMNSSYRGMWYSVDPPGWKMQTVVIVREIYKSRWNIYWNSKWTQVEQPVSYLKLWKYPFKQQLSEIRKDIYCYSLKGKKKYNKSKSSCASFY